MAKSHTPWLWSSNPLPTRLSTSFAAYSPGNWEDSWTSQKKKKKGWKAEEKASIQHQSTAQCRGLALPTAPLLYDPTSDRAKVPAAPELTRLLTEHPHSPAWNRLPLVLCSSPTHLHTKFYLSEEVFSELATRFISLPELSPPICSKCCFDLLTLKINSTGTYWCSRNI